MVSFSAPLVARWARSPIAPGFGILISSATPSRVSREDKSPREPAPSLPRDPRYWSSLYTRNEGTSKSRFGKIAMLVMGQAFVWARFDPWREL